MSLPSSDLTKWVASALIEVTENGGLSRLELYHAIEGEGIERLQIVRLGGDDARSAEEISDQLWSYAELDAENRTLELRQRYEVRSYIGESEENEAIFGFVVSPSSRVGMPHGSSSHGPTEKGVVGQFMVHDERMHTLMMQFSEATAARLMRENERKDRQIEGHQKNAIHLQELLQNLMDRQHERDLERAQSQQSARRTDDFMGLIMTMVPLITAKLLGPKGEGIVVPSLPARAARDESVMQFMHTLRSDQFHSILSTLDTNQQISLLQLAQDFAKESEKRDQQKPEVLKNGTQEEVKPS